MSDCSLTPGCSRSDRPAPPDPRARLSIEMPKLLVLVPARSAELALLADAVAEGARSVRFAEVDVRSVGDAADLPTSYKPLAETDDLASYHGIIVGVAAAEGEPQD